MPDFDVESLLSPLAGDAPVPQFVHGLPDIKFAHLRAISTEFFGSTSVTKVVEFHWNF